MRVLFIIRCAVCVCQLVIHKAFRYWSLTASNMHDPVGIIFRVPWWSLLNSIPIYYSISFCRLFFSISRRRSPHNRSSLLGYLLFSMNPLPPGRVQTEKKRKKKMTRVTKETYSFVKEPSKPMSSVVATGDGVDRTGVVVYSLPVISEDRSW